MSGTVAEADFDIIVEGDPDLASFVDLGGVLGALGFDTVFGPNLSIFSLSVASIIFGTFSSEIFDFKKLSGFDSSFTTASTSQRLLVPIQTDSAGIWPEMLT